VDFNSSGGDAPRQRRGERHQRRLHRSARPATGRPAVRRARFSPTRTFEAKTAHYSPTGAPRLKWLRRASGRAASPTFPIRGQPPPSRCPAEGRLAGQGVDAVAVDHARKGWRAKKWPAAPPVPWGCSASCSEWHLAAPRSRRVTRRALCTRRVLPLPGAGLRVVPRRCRLATFAAMSSHSLAADLDDGFLETGPAGA
jgi:hypothetical protein